ncbi:hypothetical protein [Crossiella cryophila]|uniref:Pyrrolidone-carboxylate peptidase n=1 Tax=Crossiella cryophila TaxID=43355 RepID=A0A7W7FWT9_9PSEU|nr:hypothetical protein [Crossiella cryophila]MBB4678264.1 pyrrolidone-carboxylate peptidase [Crossiella cryophila]
MVRAVWVAALVALVVPVGLAGDARAQECFDTSIPVTTEESRLGNGTGDQLLAAGGFDGMVARFRARLCSVGAGGVRGAAAAAGTELWRGAVERAQGKRPGMGTLAVTDDRPLYWARLRMSALLRQWRPGVGGDRAVLLREFDRASRGVRSVDLPAGVARRVLVSGFDPFGFGDSDLRGGNPAGAAALRLDGTVVRTDNGPAVVEAVVLPVLWDAFADGVVEDAFGTAFRRPGRAPTLIMTISQGAGFNVERWAAGWRGGQPDNNDIGRNGLVPATQGFPQPGLSFVETSLPYARMVSAATGPDPVSLNQWFCYWPGQPGVGDSECRTEGTPPPGAAAEMGSGGNFLSNESMYRANRVRIGLGAHGVPGGHLHVPGVQTPASGALTDAEFERRSAEVVGQIAALVGVAAAG